MIDQIVHYKCRCELMSRVTGCGLVSAILLIFTLISGGFALTFPDAIFLKYLSAGSALFGLLLVIVGTIIAMFEGKIIYRQMQTEFLDLPDLAEIIGEKADAITDSHRHSRSTGQTGS